MQKQTNQTGAGFSLVEVLVSLCLLSIGVMGAASMQLSALRSTQQSGFYNIALQLATEIAEQVRNTSGTSFGAGSNPLLTLDFKSSEQVPGATGLCWDVGSSCDGADMAAFGAYEVQRRLKTMLPQGQIKVCRDAAPWDDQAHSYRWDCDGAGSDAPIVVKLGWRDPGKGQAGAAKPDAVPQLVLQVQS
ncbi:type IV pilus modification protein PilV [Janthinobacterium sp. 17J80-10]|uniref:type IV pilus modification protein PilV n=1 Tax=Janthinobacterium sp. 17J80-10 TaxID=2497863 RepID=UPI001005840F|nr:type IV pilus modification protein PilV [Janthinobacterium sp. 17J80-10]QAU35240.1 type IV pilus modification protein PilV [Janthinobacterium sp. 17J80-10]